MEITVKIPKPYHKQREILNDKSRFKIICSGRRAGKSSLCKIDSVLKIIHGKKVSYITPEYTLAEKFYDEIVNIIPKDLIKSQNKSRLHLQLITGGEMKFFSGEAMHRVRGWEFDHLIVDEAAYISDLEKEWNNSLRPLLMKARGSATFISTPKGQNFFYSLFQKGARGDDGYKSWQFSTHFNPYIPKEELEELISTMPEASYRQEILAEPQEDIGNPFGTKNIQASIIENLSNRQTQVYGIDFGRVNDWSVIIGLDANGYMTYFDRFKISWEQTIERVKELRLRDPYTQIVVDATGVGSVLLERLQTHIYNVLGFEFSSKSKPMVMMDLIKDVEAGHIKVNSQTAQEMMTFEFKYTSGGNLSYNAASGYHDDCVAALAMANHHRKKVSLNDTLHIF